MKKLLLVLVSIMLMFTLTACETAEEDTRTIDHFHQAFEAAGYEILNPGPMRSGGGDIDGIIFSILLDHNDPNSDVAIIISQFDNEEALTREQRIGGGSPNIERNGMFLMLISPSGTELNEFFLAIE